VLDVPALVAVGDFLLRSGLTDEAQLHHALGAADGRRGVRRAGSAGDLLDAGAESAQESVLRVHLVRAGLPRPEVNGWIADPSGVRRYRGDLVYRRQRVIVEYEGAHHRDPTQYAADLRRRNDLLAWGWRVVHVEAAMPRSPGVVVALVREALVAPR
jgi:very-short-patch-repair endonuclease